MRLCMHSHTPAPRSGGAWRARHIHRDSQLKPVVLSWPDAGRGGDQLGNGDLMANRDRMRAHGCMSYLAVRLRRPKGGLPPLCRETAMSLDFRLSGKVSLRSTV